MTRVFRTFSVIEFYPYRLIVFFSLILILAGGCNRLSDRPWTAAVPESATALIIPDERTTLTSVTEAPYFPFMGDISRADLSRITEIENVTGNRLLLRGLVIQPTGATTWAPLYITSPGSSDLDDIHSYFRRAFTENKYKFNGVDVYRLFMRESDEILFAAELRDWIVISPSSRAVESAIRTYTGKKEAMNLPSNLEPGRLIFNFPESDTFFSQLGAVRFRPAMLKSFTGLTPSYLEVTARSAPQNKTSYTFEGNIVLDDPKSALIRNFTLREGPLQLDRIMSSEAAVFGMFYSEPFTDYETDEYSTRLDSSLVGQPGLIQSITQALDLETGFAGFYTRGFTPLEETVFLRRLRNPSALLAELNRLAERGSIVRAGNQFIVRSRYMGLILGSELCPYTEFYLQIAGDVAILAQRGGLIQRIVNDIQRRRVLYFDDEYTKIRGRHEQNLSAFVYLNSQPFRSFIEPFAEPSNDITAYLNYFDAATISVRGDQNRRSADFKLETHGLERVARPYAERWFFPLEDGIELTGPAVVTNLYDARRKDVVFATDNNRVVGLASDGTELFRVSTGTDTPIGSPVIYDWYSNNQQAILIAAGNKIYAWNNRGVTLPNFPIELDETISAPITIADVSRSGLPEIIVATGNRQLHVLNQRGNNISGWPQTTNAAIRTQPVFSMFQDEWTVMAFAENTVHAWKTEGRLHDGFPITAEAPLLGSPVLHSNSIIAGGADGYIYAISENGLFDSEYAETISESNTYRVQRVNAADSPVTVSGLTTSVFRTQDAGNQSLPLFYGHSENGSLFVYSPNGRLRFTESMGQPFAPGHHTIFTDINRNGRNEIMGIADVGRMYAWDTASGNRIESLPTTGVVHPVVARLAADGQVTIIAGSREGIRAWTILQN